MKTKLTLYDIHENELYTCIRIFNSSKEINEFVIELMKKIKGVYTYQYEII